MYLLGLGLVIVMPSAGFPCTSQFRSFARGLGVVKRGLDFGRVLFTRMFWEPIRTFVIRVSKAFKGCLEGLVGVIKGLNKG